MNKEVIYEILNGYYIPEGDFLCGDVPVENAFEKGKECEQLCEKVYQARLRLAEKLGTDEDRDVEIIINGMNEMTKIIAFKMYEYGKKKF